MKIVLSIDPAQPVAAYRNALLAAGALEEELHVVQPGDALPDEFDGLLVSGGADVDPARYGEAPVNGSVEPRPERDELDFALLARAVTQEAAVFGICRGLQVLNVALGGTLWQDLPEQRERGVAHSFSTRAGHDPAHLAHALRASRGVAGGLPFSAAIAALDGESVNSRHHQAVKDLAPGLVALAASPDDLVEAFARAVGPFLAAVQWHPENLVARPGHRALFLEFLAAARRRSEVRGAGSRGARHEPLSAAPAPRLERAATVGGSDNLAPDGPGGRIAVPPSAEAPEPR